ncbi:hypothetical protein HNY73_019714 [Argiope bruennichi]|uniref:Uncharacterized protein n=1 Tax=Argiope bruennichi TaxID=94029 RepID=A0A8T0E874_ARGBR|nr:hypothetical protein HNY73_019714 [Argiope bruennichi]
MSPRHAQATPAIGCCPWQWTAKSNSFCCYLLTSGFKFQETKLQGYKDAFPTTLALYPTTDLRKGEDLLDFKRTSLNAPSAGCDYSCLSSTSISRLWISAFQENLPHDEGPSFYDPTQKRKRRKTFQNKNKNILFFYFFLMIKAMKRMPGHLATGEKISRNDIPCRGTATDRTHTDVFEFKNRLQENGEDCCSIDVEWKERKEGIMFP